MRCKNEKKMKKYLSKEYENYYNVCDLCRILNLSVNSVYSRLRKGFVKTRKIRYPSTTYSCLSIKKKDLELFMTVKNARSVPFLTPNLFSIQSVADTLHLDYKQVYYLLKSKQLSGKKVNGSWYIRKSSIGKYVLSIRKSSVEKFIYKKSFTNRQNCHP